MTTEQPAARVPVGYATEGQGAGPVFVTERAGLFAREGLAVEIRLMHGSTGVVRGLLDGAIVFGNLAAAGLVHAALDGAELVYVTGGINQQFLVGRPGLRSVEDLAGGRIGASAPGQLPELLATFTAQRLAERGIGGIQVVHGLRGPEGLKALLDGRIDAISLSPPTAIQARRAGCPFLVDFADYGLNFTLGGVATTPATIREQPDLVRRFVRAYVAGMHRYKTDRELVLDVQQTYSDLSDRSVAEETYATTEPGFPRVPYPVTSGLRVLLDTLAQTDPRASRLDPERLVDPRFVAELEESGYIDALYASSR